MRYELKTVLAISVLSLFLLQSPAVAGDVLFAQKAAKLEKCVVENPKEYANVVKYIKFLSKRAKLYAFKKDWENAADDLRSILFITKETKGNRAYDSYVKRLGTALARMDFSPKADNRLEVAKNLYLEKKYLAAGYEFKTLSDAKYEQAVCFEYLGDIYLKLKRRELALSYYKKAYELQPQNASLNFKLAKMYDEDADFSLAQDRYIDAITYAPDSQTLSAIAAIFEAKLQKDPKNSSYYEALGRAYQELGEYSKTFPLYQKAIELDPNDIFLKYQLGGLLQEMGEFSKAVTIYNDIIAKNPYESQIRISKAKCLSAMNRNSEAVKEYQIVLAIYPDSMSAKYGIYSILSPKIPLNKVVENFYPLEPNFVPSSKFYYDFAKSLDARGQYAPAVQAYRAAITKDANNLKAYLELYDLYLAQGNEAKAFEVAQEAYKALPNNTQVRQIYSTINKNTIDKKISLALSYIKNKDYNKAVMVYSEIEPKTVGVYVSMANCYKLLKDFPSAVENMNKAIKLDPADSDLYYVLALVYIDKKDNNEALKQLTKSIGLDKNNVKAIKLANYLIQKNISDAIDEAHKYYSKGEYTKALEALSPINKRYPKDPQPYYYMGLAYDGQKKYPEALENYRLALKYDPNYDVVYFSIGELLEKYGKAKEALESYERFLSGDSEDAEMMKKAQQRVIELSKKFY